MLTAICAHLIPTEHDLGIICSFQIKWFSQDPRRPDNSWRSTINVQCEIAWRSYDLLASSESFESFFTYFMTILLFKENDSSNHTLVLQYEVWLLCESVALSCWALETIFFSRHGRKLRQPEYVCDCQYSNRQCKEMERGKSVMSETKVAILKIAELDAGALDLALLWKLSLDRYRRRRHRSRPRFQEGASRTVRRDMDE